MSDDHTNHPSSEELRKSALRNASSAYELPAAREAAIPPGSAGVNVVVDATRKPAISSTAFGHVASVSAAAKRARGANFAEKLAEDHRLHLSGFTDAASGAHISR
jgi:hypothetical protein